MKEVAHLFKHQLSHKRYLTNLDNLSYIPEGLLLFGVTTHYTIEKVQFKLTYSVKNGRHWKENIEFQVVIEFKPYLFR